MIADPLNLVPITPFLKAIGLTAGLGAGGLAAMKLAPKAARSRRASQSRKGMARIPEGKARIPGITPEDDQLMTQLEKRALLNEEGNPLTVYHGTDQPYFDMFDRKHFSRGAGGDLWGKGVYLAENPGVASGYSRGQFAIGKLTDDTEQLKQLGKKLKNRPKSLDYIEDNNDFIFDSMGSRWRVTHDEMLKMEPLALGKIARQVSEEVDRMKQYGGFIGGEKFIDFDKATQSFRNVDFPANVRMQHILANRDRLFNIDDIHEHGPFAEMLEGPFKQHTSTYNTAGTRFITDTDYSRGGKLHQALQSSIGGQYVNELMEKLGWHGILQPGGHGFSGGSNIYNIFDPDRVIPANPTPKQTLDILRKLMDPLAY